MQKWEYLTVKINNIGEFFLGFGSNGALDKWADMNQLGGDGWELVSTQFNYHDGVNRLGVREGMAYFKRPKSDPLALNVPGDDGTRTIFLYDTLSVVEK